MDYGRIAQEAAGAVQARRIDDLPLLTALLDRLATDGHNVEPLVAELHRVRETINLLATHVQAVHVQTASTLASLRSVQEVGPCRRRQRGRPASARMSAGHP